MSRPSATTDRAKRQRERNAATVSEFLTVIRPELSASMIETVVAGFSDEKLAELNREIFKQVTEDNTRYASKVCSRHGWFLDMEFPGKPAPEVADLYEKGNHAQADSMLTAYYRQRSAAVCVELVQLYPKRAELLNKAFRMHFEGDYDISVPLFLIQADGICKSIFGKHFFYIRAKALAARKAVEKRNVDWVWDALAEPFRTSPPIAAHRRTAKFLNRHLVLHGESLDYGTEMNSLKAISLLSFLCGLDSYAREKQRRDAFTVASIEEVTQLMGEPRLE